MYYLALKSIMKRYLYFIILLSSVVVMSAQDKYDIHKDFAKACKITPPLSRGVLGIGNFFLDVMPKGMRSTTDMQIKEIEVLSSIDNEGIRCWVITPCCHTEECDTTLQNRSCYLFLHGGGFVFKGAPYHYQLAKEYAMRTGAVVVFVDYRMAYNHDYGVPLQDCIDAWNWIVEHARQIGVDVSKMGIIGDSAGGFLAIKTLLYSLNSPKHIPHALMLVYPVVDCSMRTRSMAEYTDTPVWNAELNRKMWQYYLGDRVEPSLLDVPIDVLSQFPPTYIETAQYDCLREEAWLLAQLLLQAGVPTTYVDTHHTMHGFDMVQDSEITQSQISMRCKWIGAK